MAQKIVATTNITYGTADGESVTFQVGDPVDTEKYGITKVQLKDLYDAGAITIEDVPDAPVKKLEAPAKDVKSSGTSNPT